MITLLVRRMPRRSRPHGTAPYNKREREIAERAREGERAAPLRRPPRHGVVAGSRATSADRPRGRATSGTSTRSSRRKRLLSFPRSGRAPLGRLGGLGFPKGESAFDGGSVWLRSRASKLTPLLGGFRTGQIDGRPDRRTYTFHTAVVDPSAPAPAVAVPRHNYELRLLCAWPKAGSDAKM